MVSIDINVYDCILSDMILNVSIVLSIVEDYIYHTRLWVTPAYNGS